MTGPIPPYALFVLVDDINANYLNDALTRAYKGNFEAAWEQHLVGSYEDAPKKLENAYPEGTKTPIDVDFRSPFAGKPPEECALWLQNAPEDVALNREYFLFIDQFSKEDDTIQICRADQSVPSVPAPFNSSHSVIIGENTYHYLRARPSGEPKGSVLLLHGFPDLPYGWRYQVPLFTSLGYQVIVPEMLGYGQTSSPSELDAFSLKHMSDDLAALLDQILPDEQVILGGHDWGAGLLWRFAMYYPQLFKGIFALTYPYFPPLTEYVDLADEIKDGKFPTFKYQLQLRDQSLDRHLLSEEVIRQMLIATRGGLTPDGKVGFNTEGLNFENLPSLQANALLNGTYLDLFVSEYQIKGLRGPLSWYRTEKINFEDELPLAQAGGHRFTMPTLFVHALKDIYLVSSLSEGMEKYFDKLTRVDVDTEHWTMIDDPTAVNKAIQSWIETFE
ncbi:Bifunctional epoxide hydrolase 2 [Daldinia childiae]|uniref:Bifunctional epoxide hydrolase 2 n=1 Tax=Daldinia childiae TaxID=326645 RepID=UPI0014457581|nr:Bifunctional epoxide hydrolase 2 [Daldinia childiae]KAF3066435.1 Bifunctional epoxide hydrolase 2 [Daldinia childiae]